MNRNSNQRTGSVLPLMVISITALLGFVALAIDLGLMASARTQCQNAADAAALAGARTLSGDPANNNNFANCEPAARKAASANQILGTNINGYDTTNVTVQIGSYSYDATTGLFIQKIPKGATEPYSLTKVNIQSNDNKTSFGGVFNIKTFNTTATATAAHRPRDVAVILDFSGSMRFGSLLGVPYNGNRNNGLGNNSGSNNPESVYPKFGHYSSTSAGLQQTADITISGYDYTPSNVTAADTANDMRPAVVGDFYQHPVYTNPDIPAFHNTIDATGPKIPDDSTLDSDNLAGGDKPLRINNTPGNGYAKTVKDITGSTNPHAGFEANGYDAFYPSGTTLQGYTQGPRYWGKTFFMWPPDPRASKDWRKKFFTCNTGAMDNRDLYDTSGNVVTPTAGGYTINYNAILDWIKNSGPNPFPTRLHAGHITYYTAIPSSIDTSSFPPSNKDQRFWKEYIDHCLGLQQTGSSTWTVINPKVGYGDDYTWGTVQITSKPTDKYMDYLDNPKRPRTHFWFGPMSMVDFIGNYNMNRQWWPGTVHEAPLYACKIGVRAALDDVENNHPNDFVSLILFSVPRETSGDSSGRFNTVRVPLGKNYPLMQSSIWFPQATLNADGSNTGVDITPYDSIQIEAPRGYGGTCYSMGLMLAYNQFQFTSTSDTSLRKWITPSTTIPEGMVGGMGRKGAQKMVIFMSDGAPNTLASASMGSAGSIKYYKVRYNIANPSGSEYPSVSSSSDNSTSVRTEIYGIIDKLKADYSSARKPFRLHTIAFGPEYDSKVSDPTAALTTLQNMQYRGGTQSNAATPLESYKIVTGSDSSMVGSLQNAISKIMQGSIQIVLLE